MGDLLSNIPCVGDCLADSLEGVVGAVITAISCGVGCGCSLLVIGIMQLFLNPLLGGSLIAVFICLIVGVVVLRRSSGAPNKKEKKPRGENEGTQLSASPYAAPMQQPMMQQPMAQPMMQQPMGQPMQPQPYNIPVPEGAGPGTVVP